MTTLANMHEEMIESAKGVRILVRSWRPEAAPRAVVVICHGVNSHNGLPGQPVLYDTAGSADKTLKLYDGHYHDLLNDVGKEAVMADALGWINAHVPRA